MLNRIKFLDGFRGIAVLLVVLFHMELNNFGFSGVELFFVISGFIITLLLIKEYNKNSTIEIVSFFVRRIHRLYPALFVVLLSSVLIFLNYPITGIEDTFYSQVSWTSLISANWFEIIHQSGYWEQGVKSPLLHMWSLCIELQFYIFWPFFIKQAFKYCKNSIIKIRLLIFSVLIILLVILYTSSFFLSYSEIYYNTFLRASSFIIGALASTFIIDSNKSVNVKINTYIVGISVILIFLTMNFSLNNIQLFQGYITIYSLLFATLIVLILKSEFSLIRLVLENKVILFFGKISYSFYLVHMPVIAFLTNIRVTSLLGLEQSIENWKLRVIQFVLSIVLGTICWYFFEKQWRSKSKFIGIVLLIFVPVSMQFIINNKSTFTWNSSVTTIDKKWTSNDPIVTKGDKPLLIIGDSWSRRTAMGIFYAQKEKGIQDYSILSYGAGNASIMSNSKFVEENGMITPGVFLFEDFEGYYKYWIDAAKQHSPVDIIIELGNSDQHLQNVNGEILSVGDKKFDNIYIDNYQKLINGLKNDNRNIYIMNVVNNRYDNKGELMNKNIQKILENNRDIMLLNTKEWLNNRYDLYDETNHTSYDGSIYLGNKILQVLE